MAGERSGPFRQESLDRLSSPERLDELLRLADRKSWLPLAAAAALIGITLAWAVWGTVPVRVEGKGILVHPREVVEFQSPGPGYLVQLNVRVGQPVERGDVIGVIHRPDLEKQLELQRGKARELAEAVRTADRARATAPVASRALAGELRERELQSVEEERERLQRQLELARALAASQERRLSAQRQLQDSGVVSRESLIDAESAALAGLDRVSMLEANLRELHTRVLEVEQRHLERLEEIADREQQLSDAGREIERLEHLVATGTRIACEQSGKILELSATQGEFLEAGRRIGLMAVREVTPLRAVTYFTVKDGKRLKRGSQIHVTPDTVDRRRVGSILGTVSEVSQFPVTLDEARNMIGNREVAEALIAGGYRMQVVADLAPDPTEPTRLRWSSGRGPDIAISAGTTTTARVAVERHPPITFVFPFLKSAVGID